MSRFLTWTSECIPATAVEPYVLAHDVPNLDVDLYLVTREDFRCFLTHEEPVYLSKDEVGWIKLSWKIRSHDFHQNQQQNDPLVWASEYPLSDPTLQSRLTNTNIPYPQPVLLTLGDSILNLLPKDFSTKGNSPLATYCKICKPSTSHALCFN